jgi:protein involved in polysaccharide export with SLBB domain
MSLLRPTFSRRRPRRLLPCVVLLAFQAACASTGRPMAEVAAEINATLDPLPSRFLPGDSVALRFPHDANLDQTVQVDVNGNASFVLIGTVSVAGKRPEQVREELELAYKTKLDKPELSVNLIGLNPAAGIGATNRAIHVLGEVRSPGEIPYIGQQVTLVDALARSGGHIKTTALLQDTLLVRWMPDQRSWRAWRIDARPNHWGAANQVLLQANDLVYVPNTPIDNVDTWVDQYIRLLIPFPFLIAPTPR